MRDDSQQFLQPACAIVLLTFVAVLAFLPGGHAAAAPERESLGGFYAGTIHAPDMDAAIEFELVIEVDANHEVRGSLAIAHDHSPVVGRYDASTGVMRLESDFDDDEVLQVELRMAGESGASGELRGTARRGALVADLRFLRATGERRFHHDRGMPLPKERPLRVDLEHPDRTLRKQIAETFARVVDEENAIGVSAAILSGGKIVDQRHLGWEDLGRDIPVESSTMYRWASISKPLTAIAAMQLVEQGKLDLDRDIRDYVPEFPDKGHPITSRQLLGHLGGIVHYSNGKVIRTEREYAVPHPWGDRILCLDLFKESPLVSTPGEEFHYTTHGYMLLGAVVERAGGESFEQQVRSRILEPLDMTSMQPDYPWVEIPRRVVGYRGSRIGLATLDPERDVSWKLPGGGWTSTIGDLARFGLGLLEDGKLLGETTMDLLCTAQTLPDGKKTNYGLGVGVFHLDGHRMVGHSGSQSKTATYLVACRELDLGVVVMSNSRNFSPRRLAFSLMRDLLGHDSRTRERVQAWSGDIDRLVDTILEVHPDPYRVVDAAQWQAEREGLKQSIGEYSDARLTLEMYRILALAADGHTEEQATPSALRGRWLPLAIRRFADGWFVRTGHRRHSELFGKAIVAIHGVAIEQVVARIRPYVSAENDIGALDGIGNKMRNAIILEALGVIPAGTDVVPLTVRDANGDEHVVEVGVGTESWVSNGWVDADRVLNPGVRPLYRRFDRNYDFEYLAEERTLYVWLEKIRDDDGETMADFFSRVFRFIDENDVGRFVLDLRENSGGNLELNGPLLHGLIACEKVNRPGHLFVITGRDTYSAAMNLAVLLERHTHAVFVGEPTGATPNHFGDTRKFRLSRSGLAIEISELYWQNSDPRDRRPWIMPDLPVPVAFADFVAHRDPVLEAILQYDVPVEFAANFGPTVQRWRRANQQLEVNWPSLGLPIVVE